MEHTLEQVANLVREKRKASDCLVIMGDMNGRLQRGDMDSRRIGPFTPHARGDEGGRLGTGLGRGWGVLWPVLEAVRPPCLPLLPL